MGKRAGRITYKGHESWHEGQII